MGCKPGLQQEGQQASSNSGLAFLVHTNPGTADAGAQSALLLNYIYQLPPDCGGGADDSAGDAPGPSSSSTGEIDYAALDARLRAHVGRLQQQASTSTSTTSSTQAAAATAADQAGCSSSAAAAAAGPSSSGGSSSPAAEQLPGRVGPRDVAIDRASVCGAFSWSTDGLTLEALGNFTSARANTAVFAGRWFYECTVLTSGIQQIGWATIHCPFTSEEGVGDAPDSYAIDGKRLRKWNVKPQPYGEAWVQGDVLGCAIDLDARSLTFYRNGQSLGVAYDRVRTMQPSLAYFPAVSLSHTERCTLNFGAKPFAYPIPGYQPLQAPPPPAALAAADYYCGCLARLALAAAERRDEGARHGSSSGGGSGVAIGSSGGGGDKEASLADQLDSSSGGGGSPAAAVAAAVAATAACAPAPPSAAGAAAGWTCPPLTGPPVAVSSADMLLLSALVLQPLQELLVAQPFVIVASLLPLLTELQRLAGEGPASQLLLQLQLMHVVWGRSFRDVMFAVLEELAYRCQVSPLLVQDYPYTAAYPHLVLAVSLLQHGPLMRVFIGHPDFHAVMEGLLSRKAPSPKDLQQLLPHVWWQGCRDETASEERLRASVTIITTTVAKVEQRQYELLELLLATPWSQDEGGGSAGSSTGGSSATGSASGGGDCALLVFLRFLLQKNMYALRDVAPPGLSEPTVLMSTFFGLLRLLQPALQAACSGSGPLAAFPVAQLFTRVGPAAEAEPVFNMPRLGGVVTHLAREHPITDAEQQPVWLGQGEGQEQQRGSSGNVHLQDAWVPELLNSCLLLYAWRVGFNYKMIHNLAASVANGSAALEDIDRILQLQQPHNEGPQASTWLSGTRKVYHDELTRDVRLLTLLCVAFFSPGKQAALGHLSRYLALLFCAVSSVQPSEDGASGAAAADGDAATGGDAAAVSAAPPPPPPQPAVGSGSSSTQAGQPAPAAAPAAAAAAGDEGNLLRYLPLVYVDVVVDFMTALRKSADSAVGAPAMELQPAAADSFIDWAVAALDNARIANPDVHESLLSVVGLLLDNAEWRRLLERPGQQHAARAVQLVSSLLEVFDTRLWHPATHVLLKVVQDCGFGHAAALPHPPHSLQQVLLGLLQDSGSSGSSGLAPGSPAAHRAAAAKGFVNRLFTTLNWTLTEFTVAVGELHTLRGRRSILEVQNQYRRTGLMFELTVNFLRLLEFVVPTPAFVSQGVNRTRLRELLQFVLSHFTNGPDARRLNELLQTSQPGVLGGPSSSGGGAAAAGADAGAGAGAAPGAAPGAAAAAPGAPAGAGQDPLQAAAAAAAAAAARGGPAVPAYALSAVRYESSSLSERVQKTALLAPLVGIFLALWDCYQAATAAAAAAASGQAAAGQAGGSSSSSSGCSRLLTELAEMADERFMSSLRFLQVVDWSAAFPAQPLSVPLRAFGQLLDALTAARAELDAAAAAHQLPEDVPDDFLDPITMELMREPVTLPDSQIVVDRSTIERHLLSSATDPFSRAPLSMEQLQPAGALLGRIQEWLAQHMAPAQ